MQTLDSERERVLDLEPPRAVFLDRDGVINRHIPGDYVRTWDDFHFLPGALEGLAVLAERVEHVVVVTNQQGVGKGLMTKHALTEIHQRMVAEVQRNRGRIDDVMFCPHLQSMRCACRKPRPGMLLDWLGHHPEIMPRHCLMIGDSASDMELADAWPGGRARSVLISDRLVRSSRADVVSVSLHDVALRLRRRKTRASGHEA